MHQLGRTHHVGTVDVPDRLVTEAHTEQWCSDGRECSDRFADDPARLWPTRPGRQQHRVGCQRDRVVDRELIVAHDDRIGAELPEVLHQVVDEAVVAVDDEDTSHHPSMGLMRPT